MKAIIPAAGHGTRFLPVTRVVPKEMLPIGSKPALELIVEEAKSAGADEIILIISHGKELIREYFKDDPAIRFVYQEEQRGLGHAVLQAASSLIPHPSSLVLILLGDCLVAGCNAAKAMAEVSAANGGASVIGLERVPPEKVSRYGIVKPASEERTGKMPVPHGEACATSGTGVSPVEVERGTGVSPVEEGKRGTGVSPVRVVDLVEKPSPEEAPSDLAIAGRYLLSTKIFDYLRTQTPGKGGEIQLTDAIRRMIGAHDPQPSTLNPQLSTLNSQHSTLNTQLLGYVYPGKRQDIGNPKGYFEALKAMGANE